jgi:hypothetical protein
VSLVTQAKHDTQGRLRFFALGIGDAVLHALVSGIAQAGGGYSEVIGTSDYDVWEERMAAVLAQTSQEHRGTGQLRVEDEPIVQARDSKYNDLMAQENNIDSASGLNNASQSLAVTSRLSIPTRILSQQNILDV